jgi:nicotinamide phosphoribosyltransferase
MNKNRVMFADSYKYSHTGLYPKGTKYMFDYMEARGGEYPATIFFGLQYILKAYFTTPITIEEVIEAYEMAQAHGEPFDIKGWTYIVNDCNGFLPIKIRAVKEGTLVPVQNILMSVESTDENVYWIASWFETFVMKIWYPITIATKSYYVKEMLKEFSEKSGSEFVDFSYHNFGDRGSSSVESAAIGGMAHLTQFQGTDNFHALKFAKDYYGSENVGFSIPATEHSTVTSWGTIGEYDMIMNYIEKFKGSPIIACVMDSYNIFNAVREITQGEFKQKIESGEYPIFVIRPDSGNPIEILNSVINIMEENSVAYTTLDKRDEDDEKYKVWNKYRIIWGDGITPETIRQMLMYINQRGYSSDCIAFGSGGDLMQNVNRDTCKFAIKCSSITIDNEPMDVFKDPITDKGKKSKKGVMSLYQNKDKFFTAPRNRQWVDGDTDIMDVVFENGIMKREQTFEEIRKIVNKHL